MLRLLFICVLVLSLCVAQAQHSYEVSVSWDGSEEPLQLSQSVVWTNTSNVPLNKIYLLDWNHGYSSENSPLGIFLANEYDYKLIRATKQQRGFTHIKSIHHTSGPIVWKRLQDKIDVIELMLPNFIPPNEQFSFVLSYQVSLPDATFFTFGRNKKELFAHHWHLLLGVLNDDGSWQLESNLGFGTPNSPEAETRYTFELPEHVEKILPLSTHSSPASLLLTTKSNYQKIPFSYGKLVTNMLPQEELSPELKEALREISNFITDVFSPEKGIVFGAFKKDYKQHPLYALESMPQFTGAFSKTQAAELKILKTLLHQCVQKRYGNQKDTSRWLTEGLPYFLWQQYVKNRYPNLKMTGNLSEWPFIKKYHFTQASYYRSWEIAANVSGNKNRGQSLVTPPNKLTRYNRRIANPNRAGLALLYLENYLDIPLLKTLKSLPKNSKLDSLFYAQIQKTTHKPIDWFFEHYIKQNNHDDFSIKGKKVDKNAYKISVTSTNNNLAVPFSVTKTNGAKSTVWLTPKDLPYNAVFDKTKTASITLNKAHLIPELSLNNNSFNLGRTFFRNNLQLKLLQDIPKSGKSIVLVSPEFGYNIYDGLMAGITLGNSSLLSNNFRYKISPFYGLKSKQFNGMAFGVTNLFHEKKSHYLTRFTLFGSSYHYEPEKRYSIFTPSVEFFYRPKGIQNNHRSSLLVRHVSVNLQDLPIDDERRNYGVSVASFKSKNGNALENVFYRVELQWASAFKKASIETEYIVYYLPNRRAAFRIFGGSFLQNNLNDSYFDFNTSKVNDYLFQYDLYGRSESQGFFSQQYIKAGGGLRTSGEVGGANRWLITSQVSTTLWRWIEGYAEIGWIKNTNHKAHTHWGTGVSMNIIPDFFEIHFPLYDATGNLMQKRAYANQIRFQLSLSPSGLVRLFSRTWF